MPVRRAERLSDEEKARRVLQYMRQTFNKFSLRKFLETCFLSESKDIWNFTGTFMEDGGAVRMMELWWDSRRRGEWGPAIVDWVVDRAAEECARECSYLTDRASAGPFAAQAEQLRVPVDKVSVSLVHDFTFPGLSQRYALVTPYLQQILIAAIGKSGPSTSTGSRNPDDGRAALTSMVLNLRSRLTNYHAAVNVLMLWQAGASKRLVQILNRLGFCASYEYQGRAILRLSQDAVRLARHTAADRSKIKMLAYDNFNWRSRAWETSATHGTVQHDQVSAMLVILNISEHYQELTANHLMSTTRLDAQFGARHRTPQQESLQNILPMPSDHTSFRDAAILHVKYMLTSDIKSFAQFRSALPSFHDPHAITAQRTERHWLPTFDQEQGSTRGNMVVLEHYLLDVLRIPKAQFEQCMVGVLGDRLTTARDRAAQDQRALDRSSDRADHLSSILLTSGMMHQCLNMVINIARNAFGDTSNHDEVSLSVLRDLLPNRDSLNLKKVDFYAWLRFLDVVLRSLVLAAVIAHLNVGNRDRIAEATKDFSLEDFNHLCVAVAEGYILPTSGALEHTGIKSVRGETVSGHALTLMHSLMTVREMRHAIKYGHPTRMLRMLKYWVAMFYGGGSYNYSNECMELLHNVLGDWPEDTAQVMLAGMLVNTTGRPDGFKEGDLDVEHLNKSIKGRAHGVNASPELLERITPALGQTHHLMEQICGDLGLANLWQRHSEVRQDKDVEILVGHLVQAHVFHFARDKISKQTVTALFHTGLRRLSGPTGGHAKHILRHQLRLRSRHANGSLANDSSADADMIELAQELEDAADAVEVDFTTDDVDDDITSQVHVPTLNELSDDNIE
ncbi:hypothetical protein BDW22DRAFT_1339041 [Trametopsis cervina]|nr:hypothetical protein BDW22DRAFT_1339041 [Trametopsis cervina]